MPGLLSSLLCLFAACCVLAVATSRHWKTLGLGSEVTRKGVGAIGWALLAFSAAGFGSHFGWEVGLAWAILWLFAATLLATALLSVRPRFVPWIAGALSAAAFITWIA